MLPDSGGPDDCRGEVRPDRVKARMAVLVEALAQIDDDGTKTGQRPARILQRKAVSRLRLSRLKLTA